MLISHFNMDSQIILDQNLSHFEYVRIIDVFHVLTASRFWSKRLILDSRRSSGLGVSQVGSSRNCKFMNLRTVIL